jgi:hypothetical protein
MMASYFGGGKELFTTKGKSSKPKFTFAGKFVVG